MPLDVLAPSPDQLIPYLHLSAFSQARTFEANENLYPDGSFQVQLLASESRKSWSVTVKCTAVQLTTLRGLFTSLRQGADPVYFFDPYETNPLFVVAPGSGNGTAYIVKIEDWHEQINMARHLVSFKLTEVA